MKVTINIDCSPEEARRFFGLPDLAPVHEAYVEQLRSAVSEGVTPEALANMIRSWGPLSEGSLKLWSSFFSQPDK